MKRFDVLIIGAGAVGNAIAREISKKKTIGSEDNLTVAVLEKEPDVAFGISGRNSGVLHAGFNNKPGSLMAKLCVEGSEGFESEAEGLGIDFKRTGKLIFSRFEEDLPRLNKLKEQGEANGVRELRIIGKEELEALTGYEAGTAALWSGMTGVFDPFRYTIALAEAAEQQGTKYFFGRTAMSIEKLTNGSAAGRSAGLFRVTARNEVSGETDVFEAGILINSAGLYADEICRMAGIDDFKVYPCRGEYHILDKRQSELLALPIYPIPNEKEGGLGVHLTPTAHGNIMIGPSAEYMPDDREREDYSTTLEIMNKLSEEGHGLFPKLDVKDCIRSFSGMRPKLVSEEKGGYADFVIEESTKVSGFIQLVGIESPGLTSSIPIGRMVARIAAAIRERDGAPECLSDMKAESGKNSADASKPDNGEAVAEISAGVTYDLQLERGDQKMICRCEGITEEAVLEAYDRILMLGAIPTIKGLKNRCRVTMGSCQGSFCTVNLVELLQKKRNIDPLKLLWNGFGSLMFEGRVKE